MCFGRRDDGESLDGYDVSFGCHFGQCDWCNDTPCSCKCIRCGAPWDYEKAEAQTERPRDGNVEERLTYPCCGFVKEKMREAMVRKPITLDRASFRDFMKRAYAK